MTQPMLDSMNSKQNPSGESDEMTTVQQRRLFACARNLSMTDQERLDFAEIILKKDVLSWKDLTGFDAARLIDAFEGYEKITWMLLSRGPEDDL